MILVQQGYRSSDPVRQAELDHARALNRSVACLRDIVDLDGELRRWTYADVFALVSERYPGQTIVLSNSDISFDESLEAVAGVIAPGVLVALTRWDDATAPSMEGRVDPATWKFYSQSQDTWIFVAAGLPPFTADFRLGVPRCENRLAYEAAAAGVVVIDPALAVRSAHHHASNVRSWKRGDHYRGGLLFPRLTTLESRPAEALVAGGTWRRTVRHVVLDGCASSFASQLSRPVARRGSRLGWRSPIYWRG